MFRGLGFATLVVFTMGALLFLNSWRLTDRPHYGSPTDGNPIMVSSAFGAMVFLMLIALMRIVFGRSRAFDA